jgi:hypothetical protein
MNYYKYSKYKYKYNNLLNSGGAITGAKHKSNKIIDPIKEQFDNIQQLPDNFLDSYQKIENTGANSCGIYIKIDNVTNSLIKCSKSKNEILIYLKLIAYIDANTIPKDIITNIHNINNNKILTNDTIKTYFHINYYITIIY